MSRGTGRTTAQLKALPIGGTFVWCNGRVDYPKALARFIGRPDILIRPRSFLDGDNWRGLDFPGFAIDHAFSAVMPISAREADSMEGIRMRMERQT